MLNYFFLSDEELGDIRKEIIGKLRIKQPFTYYINNCVSVSGCPNRFGSAMCDLIHRGTNDGRVYDMDVVGKLINDTFYKHVSSDEYFVLAMIKDVVSVICDKCKQKEYLERLEHRYGMR